MAADSGTNRRTSGRQRKKARAPSGSSLVHVPTVIGWLRPVILAPMESLTGLPLEHIEALLAHELAHIRRRDYTVSILQCIVEAVLFYHPAVWWISEQMRAQRELCCDDLAVAVCGDVLTYAHPLAELDRCNRLL
jgi:beta-lactamase regulating signal transducer with metallopeptidase domain